MIDKEDLINILLFPIALVVLLFVLIKGKLSGDTIDQTLNEFLYES